MTAEVPVIRTDSSIWSGKQESLSAIRGLRGRSRSFRDERN
jgi:hypothetical protein